jgi:hypothetical protein
MKGLFMALIAKLKKPTEEKEDESCMFRSLIDDPGRGCKLNIYVGHFCSLYFRCGNQYQVGRYAAFTDRDGQLARR